MALLVVVMWGGSLVAGWHLFWWWLLVPVGVIGIRILIMMDRLDAAAARNGLSASNLKARMAGPNLRLLAGTAAQHLFLFVIGAGISAVFH